MTDIVNELRDRSYATKAKDPLCERAADEIERLRGYRDEAESAASIAGLVADRLRLTAEERAAIEEACDEGRWYPADYHRIHTLRGLLLRTAPRY